MMAGMTPLLVQAVSLGNILVTILIIVLVLVGIGFLLKLFRHL